jgi:NitT/TauT family transport system substrate-binding protein
MKRSTITIAMAIAATVLAWSGTCAAQDVQKLKMLYTTVTGFTAAYVAQEQGFFKKHGVDMEFVVTNSSGNNPPAMVSGSVQVGGPTMPTILQANDAGLDIVVFAAGTVYPMTGDVLVARQGSEIQKTTDLKGKRVGVPGLGALLHIMLRRDLKANGVDPDGVKYVEIGFQQAAEALKSGAIDAYPSQAPFTARILQSGAGYEVANWLKSTPDGTLTVVYAATRKWATENRKLIDGMRAAMREAVAFSKEHRDEMYHAIATYTKLPPPVVSSLPPPILQVDISPQQIQWWIDVCKEQGLIKGNPDAKKILFQ